MKISRDWLQTFFEKPLPSAVELSHALTFHAFEIDGIENDVLDVKVTPNRGHDCLSYRSIAKEVSAILSLPLKEDPLKQMPSLEPKTDTLKVTIEDPNLCRRFTAAVIENVSVGPSPEWLVRRLHEMGQQSINNVVDATNFVMFNIGQPLHAFDAGKLSNKQQATSDSGYAFTIRRAKKGEKLIGLDDKEYTLSNTMLAITDTNTGEVLSIAGIKGGKSSGIDANTKSIILEGANWDGVTIRKASQALRLRTDASQRFEQQISPELTVFGVHAAAQMIADIAKGKVVGYVDDYPTKQERREVPVSVTGVNRRLGTQLTAQDVESVLTRLGLEFKMSGEEFVVAVPFERLDIEIPEDLIEEVGRIVGYDKVAAVELSAPPAGGLKQPEINQNFAASERIREEMVTGGYSEVYTSVFADKGERAVSNKIGGDKPYLRATLTNGLNDALKRNVLNKDLLGVKEVRLFEIGTIWKKDGEIMMVGTVSEREPASEKPLRDFVKGALEKYTELPLPTTERYEQFSKYPYIVRDVALWTPTGTSPDEILDVIRKHSGELLQRSELFDTFQKGDKTSYAFRLVFQSFDRTLFDEDANERMTSIYDAVKTKGWEVR